MSETSLKVTRDAFDPHAIQNSKKMSTWGVNASRVDRNLIEDGLDFILGHFQDCLFPRTISTKTTEGRQVPVYNKEEALAGFKAADYLDCKISAYPKYVEWQGINRQAPNLIFIDLDQGTLRSKPALDLALNKTLQNIKDRLYDRKQFAHSKPTVIWSGHGYHIYQPIEAFVLEQECKFAKFEQPSRRFMQFAEYYLSDKKSDPCHKITMSFKNCMLRVPGSFNAKEERIEVRIIQRWDGFRPSIKPLLFDLYIYLQDLKLKKITQKHQHLPGRFCPYWRKK
jgi:hypothetical protein